MRLTLRTLLAYLDNTLDPGDSEVLRAKLAESGFATQLVQRIRRNLVSSQITAPPPEAVAPVEDANTIAEYLDSTLPDEQVAEIERACLDSDIHLAEAAACHQILTMVLGQSADVPTDLRDRIYQMPDREIDKIAASSQRFSSLSIDSPPASPFDGALGARTSSVPSDSEVLGGSSSSTNVPLTDDGQSVTPVGPTDSGVADAPTRLRESGVLDAKDIDAEPAIAGARPRSREDQIYGGPLRSRRITPLLVSLGLAVALLFAVKQVFQPLIGDHSTSSSVSGNLVVPDERLGEAPLPRFSENSVSETEEAVIELDPPFGQPDNLAGPSEVDELPMPSQPSMLPRNRGVATENPSAKTAELIESSGGLALMPEGEQQVIDDKKVAMDDLAKTDEVENLAPPMPRGTPAGPALITAEQSDPVPSLGEAEVKAKMNGKVESVDAPERVTDLKQQPDQEEILKPPPQRVTAMIDGKETMVVTLQSDGQWQRIGKMGEVRMETPVVCAPKFRARMWPIADEGESPFEVTMLGPVGMRWLPVTFDDATKPLPGIEVNSGNLLITSKQPGAIVPLKLGNTIMDLVFPEEESVVATIVRYSRHQGADPFEPANRSQLVGLLCVQGSVEIEHEEKTETISTGSRWLKRDNEAPEIAAEEKIPSWAMDPTQADADSLDKDAREFLLGLTDNEKPIEVSLREALAFRRSEVVALAAQTLLQLGQADVYFGAEGIFGQPRQRQYWSDHFDSLVSMLDAGADSAEWVLRGIEKMDEANSPDLFKLLEGYSQEELANGGDRELVGFLDSESMAVRVLALENLRKITGTTLYFRAELDTSSRRAPGIKKWLPRLNRGEIRWKPKK